MANDVFLKNVNALMEMHSNGLLGGEIMLEDVLINVDKGNERFDVLHLLCP